MALFKFTKGILEGTPIDIYNNGEMWRDFTYVTDLVRGIRALGRSQHVLYNIRSIVTVAESGLRL